MTEKRSKRNQKMPDGKKPGLTGKAAQFCLEYIVDFNGTQAAIRAGYSEKSAARTAGRLLNESPDVQARIIEVIKERAKRTEITADRVLEEVARIAFLDPGDFFGEDNSLLDIDKIPVSARRALGGLSVSTRYVGRGDDAEALETTKVKFVDKLKALEILCRHLGIGQDKDDGGGKTVVPLTINVNTNPVEATVSASN